MSRAFRGLREDGESVSLGVKMACSSSSIRLVRENDDKNGEQRRPLSPVSIRTKLPEDIKVEAPPTSDQIRRANEVKALESPFIQHKTRREKETWLLKLGSLRKAEDETLKKELDLQSQLNKIISPIKTRRSSRNLHKPKLRKMPEHVQRQILEETHFEEKRAAEKFRQEEEQVYFSSGGVGMGGAMAMAIDKYPSAPKSIPSISSIPSQAAVVVGSNNDSSTGDGHGPLEPHDHEIERPWLPFEDSGGSEVYGGSINMASGVVIRNAATPISALSDLSDRDVFSAGSHLSGGLYGDFEDDLVSAGGSNHDEHEYILEEKI